MSKQESEIRFKGIIALYGKEGFDKLQNSHVLVIGTGGVGSWLAEALCRTAIGKLTLIDADTIELGNSNRQLHTMTSTLGQSKVQTLANRFLDINPNLEIIVNQTYLTVNNINDNLDNSPIFIAEAIDDLKAKAYIIDYLVKNNKIFICAGGAGGRKDPGCLKIADLSECKGNALLATLRRDLRTKYGFPKQGRKMHVPCVYSDESALYSQALNDDITLPKFGASMAVTASCGLLMASYLIDKIVKQ